MSPCQPLACTNIGSDWFVLNNRIGKNPKCGIMLIAHRASMSMLMGLSLPMHAHESLLVHVRVKLAHARPLLNKLPPGQGIVPKT